MSWFSRGPKVKTPAEFGEALAESYLQGQAKMTPPLPEVLAAVELPEPALFTHELISNSGGVHLGCAERGVCERAYTEGETSEEIREWYTADQLRAYGEACRTLKPGSAVVPVEPTEAMRTAGRKATVDWETYPDRHLVSLYEYSYAAMIAAAPAPRPAEPFGADFIRSIEP